MISSRVLKVSYEFLKGSITIFMLTNCAPPEVSKHPVGSLEYFARRSIFYEDSMSPFMKDAAIGIAYVCMYVCMYNFAIKVNI